jgi:uridine phosphorylase
MGGSNKRMEDFAKYIMKEIGYELPADTQLEDISYNSHRFCLYKVGPVLSVSHGMGTPSLAILLQEITKLMYHAKCKDPVFIRIGSCGGIGVEGGTVVVTEEAVDGLLKSVYDLAILGKMVSRPAIMDKDLARELKELSDASDGFQTVLGKTMCAHDYYEGQGRTDGAFYTITEAEKMEYLQKLADFGVVNIEMECTTFAALTHAAGIRSAIVCVAFLNRLNGDQVTLSQATMSEWQERPFILVAKYIKKRMLELGISCG